jgi:hypothetical protein
MQGQYFKIGCKHFYTLIHPFIFWEIQRLKVKNIAELFPMATKTLLSVAKFLHSNRELVFDVLPISCNHLQHKESGEVQC